MGFTKVDNSYFDTNLNLTNAEFRVLMCIIRLTIGYQGRRKYKIPYSQITKMTTISGVSKICTSLKEKGFIDFDTVNGKSNVITIKPMKSVNGLQNKPMKSVDDTNEMSALHQSSELNGSRGAKEKYKENLKKDVLFLEFKNNYPENKFDDATSFDAWQSLTDTDKQLVVGVMEYQNNGWADIDRKYIPKASNYLLNRKFLEDAVREPYESEIRREKAKIEQQEYYQKAEQDSATPEEIKAILENALKPIDKQRINNGKG